eukprot:13369170-Alexandrium_andersonii.AAC.1
MAASDDLAHLSDLDGMLTPGGARELGLAPTRGPSLPAPAPASLPPPPGGSASLLAGLPCRYPPRLHGAASPA